MKRGPSELRRSAPRTDERLALEERWEKNRRRRATPPSPKDTELARKSAISTLYTFDADGKEMIIPRRGDRALAEIAATDKYFAELRTKVEGWNRKRGKNGEHGDAKDINGRDVMEVLALASALTNNPAYEAARKAMRLHRLDKGGLRRAFRNLQRRHGHDLAPDLSLNVAQYIDQFGYGRRQAIEHVVADLGVPGKTFESAVNRLLKAFARRTERGRYFKELHGLA